MQAGDYVRLTCHQSITGLTKPVINVWYMECTDVTGTVTLNNFGEFVALWWVTDVCQELKNVQSSSLVYERVDMDNLDAFETEFISSTEGLPGPGGETSTVASVALTYSIQMTRQFRTTRNGRKSIGGVPEAYVSNNQLANGAVEGIMAWFDVLNTLPVLTDGAGNSAGFRIVIPKTPVAPATRPSVFNPVTGFVLRGLGSQVTRKELF